MSAAVSAGCVNCQAKLPQSAFASSGPQLMYPHNPCGLEALRRRSSAFSGPWAREFRQPDGEEAAGNDCNPTPASVEAVAADEDIDSSPQPGDVTETDEAEDPARNPEADSSQVHADFPAPFSATACSAVL